MLANIIFLMLSISVVLFFIGSVWLISRAIKMETGAKELSFTVYLISLCATVTLTNAYIKFLFYVLALLV